MTQTITQPQPADDFAYLGFALTELSDSIAAWDAHQTLPYAYDVRGNLDYVRGWVDSHPTVQEALGAHKIAEMFDQAQLALDGYIAAQTERKRYTTEDDLRLATENVGALSYFAWAQIAHAVKTLRD